jgi:hypothetical protein
MRKAERRMRRGPGSRAGMASLTAQLVMGGLLLGAALPVAVPLPLAAQAAAQRVVEGKVLLGSGGAAQGAIVYLKNAKTLEVRTYISTADGGFRFGQLTSDSDYTIWAEYQGKKSKEKTISSFDTKKTFEITLKVEV